jgi:hypothetical protein
MRGSIPGMWPPPQHRRWLLVNALGVTALVNATTTGLIAWATVHGMKRIPLWSWSRTSTLIDGEITLFTLPLITTVVLTLVIRRARRRGHLERLRGLATNRPWLALLPGPLGLRAPLAGAVTAGVLAAPVAAGLVVAGGMPTSTFVVYKACFAVVLGALVTPLLALRAMAEP